MEQDSSKKTTGVISAGKTVCAVCVFILAFFLIAKAGRFLLNDDVKYYTRVMMHELYSEPEIDVLFVGSSHCFRSVNPVIADPIFNKKTFNGGSSHQRLDGSYSVIRECARSHKLKEVYVELFYGTNPDVFKERSSMTGTYILSDYMRFSPRKVLYLLNASSPEHYTNSFLVASRERGRLANPKALYKTLKKKLAPPYRNYTYENITMDDEAYIGRGYVASYEANPEGGIAHEPYDVHLKGNTLSEDSRVCIKKIISFCDAHDIRVSFFSSPMPDFRLIAIGGYDNYIREVKQVLEGTSAGYYDFNLCRPEYLSLSETDFMDSGHLNDVGAEKFTPVISGFFSGKISGTELFYNSYEEKLQAAEDKVLGFTYVRIPQSGIISLRPSKTKPETPITLHVDLRPDPVQTDPVTGEEISRGFDLESDGMFYVPCPDGEHGLATLEAFSNGVRVCYCYFGY
ncbi:MAG: hypothetical protein K5985_11675 [Lachnospiraceae bacterium]|nr:hypothetical protein [Lachnospiraceae bacterium]